MVNKPGGRLHGHPSRRPPGPQGRKVGRLHAIIIVAIFCPFSQFCEINVSLLSLQTQPNTAPNLFQRGVEYGKYDYDYDYCYDYHYVYSRFSKHKHESTIASYHTLFPCAPYSPITITTIVVTLIILILNSNNNTTTTTIDNNNDNNTSTHNNNNTTTTTTATTATTATTNDNDDNDSNDEQ